MAAENPLSSTDDATIQSPLVFFLAGALVPTLAWFLLSSYGKSSRSNITPLDGDDECDDDDDDSDVADTSVGGPSSKWGYMDAPYKVRMKR